LSISIFGRAESRRTLNVVDKSGLKKYKLEDPVPNTIEAALDASSRMVTE
jgi:hypothetical protein